MEAAESDQRRQQRADDRACGNVMRRVGREGQTEVTAREEQADDDQQRHGRELQYGKGVLHPRACADTEEVHRDDEADRSHGKRLRPVVRDAHRLTRVVGEGRGNGGDTARVVDERHRPAEQKGRQLAEGFAKVDVGAARLWTSGAELGVTEHPGEGEQTTEGPEHEDLGAGTGELRAGGRRAEDARADDTANDDHRGIPDAEATEVMGWLRCWHPPTMPYPANRSDRAMVMSWPFGRTAARMP